VEQELPAGFAHTAEQLAELGQYAGLFGGAAQAISSAVFRFGRWGSFGGSFPS
jgi:hypothetical protein